MKQKRVQSPKVRSVGAKALTLSRRGNEGDRIPSGTAYKRPKSGSQMKAWSNDA